MQIRGKIAHTILIETGAKVPPRNGISIFTVIYHHHAAPFRTIKIETFKVRMGQISSLSNNFQDRLVKL